jgi:hypothetical protein
MHYLTNVTGNMIGTKCQAGGVMSCARSIHFTNTLPWIHWLDDRMFFHCGFYFSGREREREIWGLDGLFVMKEAFT